MNSALPGEARAPGATEAEPVGQEVACSGWRLDTTARMPAQRVAPAGLSDAFVVVIGAALLPAAAAGKYRP
jgi:hypothetical protein